MFTSNIEVFKFSIFIRAHGRTGKEERTQTHMLPRGDEKNAVYGDVD